MNLPASKPPARRDWRVGLALGLLFLGLPCLGLVGGFQVAQAAARGNFNRWQRMPAPRAPAALILAGGTGLSDTAWWIYVRSATGTIYYCPPYTAGDCWVPAAEPLDLPAYEPCEIPGNFAVPPLPGRVLDSLEAQACNGEAVYQVNFAVLDDGSVWRWQHFTSGLSALAEWLVGSLCGALLGVLSAGTITAVVLWRRRHKRPDRLSAPL